MNSKEWKTTFYSDLTQKYLVNSAIISEVFSGSNVICHSYNVKTSLKDNKRSDKCF